MAAAAVDRGRLALMVLGGIIVLGLVLGTWAVVSLDRSVDRTEVSGLGERSGGASDDDTEDEVQPASDGPGPDPLTVLVLGSDTREVLTAEERRELGTGDAWGERTETIALVRLDPAADTLRMLSVPRDTLLTRCDGSRGRVNAAYGIGESADMGGISCVVQTLTQWGDIAIDHAAKVDFRGFVDIVDSVGGVPITLDEPISDQRANLDLPAGCTRLDGAQALAFVRARSIDSDYGRIERQQRFVEELRTEVSDLGILRDLPQLYRTASATARAAELDSGLTLPRIQQLARQHRETLEAPVEGRSIPGTTDASDGIAFLRVDDDDVRAAFRWLEHGGERPADAYDGALGEPEGPSAGTTRPSPEDEREGDGADGAGGDGAASVPRC